MTDIQYRAEFDATVVFGNGGGLHAEAFRVDVPSSEATPDQIAALFIASMNLLMVERVDLRNVRVSPRRTRGLTAAPAIQLTFLIQSGSSGPG